MLKIINGKVWFQGSLQDLGIVIENDFIKTIEKNKKTLEDSEIFDADGKIIFPGFIDVHTHLRDSNLQYKEDFESGTSAAIAGGYTTVLDMPNTDPPVTTREILEKRISNANNRIFTNVGFISSPLEESSINELDKAGSIAYKIYLHRPFDAQDLSDESLTKIMNKIEGVSKPIIFHAEELQGIDYAHEKEKSVENEVNSIKRVIRLLKSTNVKVHFAHISTQIGLNEIIRAKNANFDITVEATPHHSLLNIDNIDLENRSNIELFKCEPPLRNIENSESIKNGLIDGSIDIAASDHAPHTVKEKINEGKPGFPNLEITARLMLDLVLKDELKMNRFIELLVDNPVKRFNLLKRGMILEGYKADLTIIDPKKSEIINSSEFYSKAKYSPFEGHTLNNSIYATIVNGKISFSNGKINNIKPGEIL